MVAVLFVLLVVNVLVVHLSSRARGSEASRCETFRAASAQRADVVTGSGRRLVVIGDSYAVGLGLDNSGRAWPSRLPGEVHVAGFSGSGFSRGASDCGAVSFATRAPAAVRGGADLVVVEGGLNDYNQPDRDIRAGFARLMASLDGLAVVVVGPPSAPSRASAVPHLDGLLASLSARYGAAYVSTSAWDLTYLSDRLHLTEAGHRAFGDNVARAVAALPTA